MNNQCLSSNQAKPSSPDWDFMKVIQMCYCEIEKQHPQFFVMEQAELLSISLLANCNLLLLPRKMEALAYKKVSENHQPYRYLAGRAAWSIRS